MTAQQIDSLLQLENDRPRLEADSSSLELKKESKKRRQKQPGKLMAEACSQPHNHALRLDESNGTRTNFAPRGHLHRY
ncbi:hypothetical protein P5673_006439 [Acropora cervicornis]|uniref:Uncharacterized protein n=1 Tax=Acropora cervicornis TaxID=6130 RepID=A0AAD9QXS0_ACRCE|nr:hypothetical protein P5673_006439 [Acropora cervicornis]